jgi:hypothetical protein
MKRLFDKRRSAHGLLATALLAAGLLVSGCGDDDDHDGEPMTNGAMDGTMSGTAVKGPVANANVSAYGVTNGAKGAQLGTARTDAQGRFTMKVGRYSGPVLMEMRNGSYTDEATNATMPMGTTDALTCVVPSFAAGSSTTIAITPVTSMAQAMAESMPDGMTAENIADANRMMGSYFSVADILHTMPMDPLVAGSGATATQEMKNYGMTLAAMSQYASTLGMTTSSGMVTLMMEDVGDGTMNGMMGSTPISMSGMGGMMGGTTMMPETSGTSELAHAMEQFVESDMNRSGVPMADMQPLVDKLAASSGDIR